MAMRRRASFNGASITSASITRRSSLSPDIKDEVAPTTTTTTTTNTIINASAAASASASAASSSPAPSTTSSIDKVTPNILTVLSSILERLIARNEKQFPVLSSPSNKKLTNFHGLRAPSISVGKYLERIYKYTNSSLSCFVVAYIYIDRLVHQQPDQPITSMNVHRLLVTSIMIAAKVVDDVHFNNAFYARVGGITNAELNKLELKLLFCLDFKVQVTLHVFESYCSHLERELHNIGYVRVQRSLPVFGDLQELADTQKILKEGLEQR